MADKTENEIRLSKRDRWDVCWRSTFLQGSWNYERMQNGGYAYAMIPAIKKLYKNKDDQAAALKRHLEFFNTHPYLASPIIGVTLALEEEKANGAAVDDVAISGVKVGMMGPLAGVGDRTRHGRLLLVWGPQWQFLAISLDQSCSSCFGTPCGLPLCGTRRNLATMPALRSLMTFLAVFCKK